MTKDFSRFAPKEIDDFSENVFEVLERRAEFYKWFGVVGWTLAAAEFVYRLV